MHNCSNEGVCNEGSSATRNVRDVTDVTDVSPMSVGRRKREEGRENKFVIFARIFLVSPSSADS
ncbi:hypothetical protein [Tychonema sp. LEGE 06208]|uniref:hypothetical protein n=1 Tax=Tychonema sp. LEGE 06208 TaxID=1828663 RepID=UPI0018825F45|nr:hypothetical protein [Tychonema sp. LEGE 06208]MBE9163528.1 hypothetical protein [Tychonema sp. LEGE 06208]